MAGAMGGTESSHQNPGTEDSFLGGAYLTRSRQSPVPTAVGELEVCPEWLLNLAVGKSLLLSSGCYRVVRIQDWQTSCKGQERPYFRFVEHVISITATQLRCCINKVATNNMHSSKPSANWLEAWPVSHTGTLPSGLLTPDLDE